MSRFYIQDYAIINALGETREQIWSNWQQGQSPGICRTDKYSPGIDRYVAAINAELPEMDTRYEHYRSRNNRLLKKTGDQLQATLQPLIKEHGAKRIGLVLGTSTSGIAVAEDGLEYAFNHDGEPAADYQFTQHEMGAGADFLRTYLGLEGPALMISTACSSSGNAFATARRLISTGICDAVVVGGADTLCRLTIQGFASLESVSPEVCNPMSQNRSGITIGEASALFVISQKPAALELLGVGQSSDAHHISAPEPEGKGAQAAMQAALSQAGVEASDVDYVNLHGTATPLNDSMESKAVDATFAHKPLCSSTKSLTGHTLGAAAANELGFCALLLENTVKNGQTTVPAQVWDGQRDPDLAPINIAAKDSTARPIKMCLSNSFAFGGNNTSLLVGINHDYLA